MKKVLVLAFVSLIALFASCTGGGSTVQEPAQPEQQLTLKDSLLLELKGFLGDTVRTRHCSPEEIYYIFSMPANNTESFALEDKIANRFDKVIRTQRETSEKRKYNLYKGGLDIQSTYRWENYDYKISLYINHKCTKKNAPNEDTLAFYAYRLQLLVLEK